MSFVRTSLALARARACLELAADCGISSLVSSASSDPSGSSSRTSPPARNDGWTPWCLTWDSVAMRSYRSRCQQQMSALRTCDDGSSLLPTPSASEYGTSGNGDPGDGRGEYAHRGTPSLYTMARHGMLPTPTATEHKAEKAVDPSWASYRKGARLTTAVLMLPTPLASDGSEKRGLSIRGKNAQGGPSLSERLLLPTPTVGDAAASGSRCHEGSSAHPGVSLTDVVVHGRTLEAHGPRTTGGRLEPQFVEWLMGLPLRWTEPGYGLLATPSSPSVPKLSDGSSESWQESEMKGPCKNCNRNVLYEGAEYCSPKCQEAGTKTIETVHMMQGRETGEWRAADISDCGSFRYLLARVWGPPPWALFIGLNPSKADGDRDDPTVQRWRRFTRLWGFGGFVVGNLSALRATDSRDLEIADYPIGIWNDQYIVEAAGLCDRVVVCWGSSGGEWALKRGREIQELLEGREIWSWGLNADGNPRHPIARGKNRLRDEVPLQRWAC